MLKSLYTNKWLRVLLPIVLIVGWFVIASIGGPTFGKLNNVTSNQQVDFLPASADSTKVQTAETKFVATNSIPAIVIIKNPNNYHVNYYGLRSQFAKVQGVSRSQDAVIGPIASSKGNAVEYIVQVDSFKQIESSIKDMRTILSHYVPSGANYYVTGPAGISADLVHAFSGIDGILLWVAVAAVFIILLIVYRSIILPFLVLVTAMFALSGAILLVYTLASHGVIKLNGESQGILSILVIGAATDYSLLIISRYRETLHEVSSKYKAMAMSLRGVIEPIAASAATVVIALLCLLTSDLNSNKSLGPIASFGIIFAFLAGLSFLPSVLVLLGRKAFWPFEPHLDKPGSSKIKTRFRYWARVSNFIGNHYRAVWLVCCLALLALCLGLTQLKASGITNSENILGKSNAVAGQSIQAQYFPAGTGSPLVILADQPNQQAVLSYLKSNPAISSLQILTPRGLELPDSTDVKIVNNQVLIEATLVAPADSMTAQNQVKQIRQGLKQVDPSALVGGETAIIVDTNKTAENDLIRIIPLVLAVILVILILLLRSLVAPFYLVLSVVLSFAATMGLSALFFNHVFHFPGSDPSVPLFGFIFLVALGVDYNIFLMTRVREESTRLGTRPGIKKGLTVTGSVITSAGVVLAATFASLSVIPILFLVQIAFIVAVGVLIDTIIVRSLLVPALSYDIGKHIWWPSKLSKKK